jgi:hypothetical protein
VLLLPMHLKTFSTTSYFFVVTVFFTPVKHNYTNILDHLKIRTLFVRRRHLDVLVLIVFI